MIQYFSFSYILHARVASLPPTPLLSACYIRAANRKIDLSEFPVGALNSNTDSMDSFDPVCVLR